MKPIITWAALLLLGMLAPSFAQDKAKDFTSSVGAKMIWVKSGSVKVDPKTIEDDDEFKQVTVKSGYYLAATEVTQVQYQAVMGSNPSAFKGSKNPVERVNWREAMEYCRRLTEKDQASGKLPKGYIYTLPTEVQWEYACRAGTTGDYTGPPDEMAWHSDNAGTTTHPVATKHPNQWGFYDMHGNVWEWCANRYEDRDGRAFRGGNWGNGAEYCRSGIRGWSIEAFRNYNLGFRPAAVLASSIKEVIEPPSPESLVEAPACLECEKGAAQEG